MKQLFVNFKRFDIPRELGGVNSLAPIKSWAEHIVGSTQDGLKEYGQDVQFVMFFPEAHLLGAVNALKEESVLRIGCQGVYRDDVAQGGNFGAFTTNRTAKAAVALGCTDTLIGHCEERRDKLGIMEQAGITDTDAVNRLMNMEIKQALSAGLKVLYCIGETANEQADWQNVLRKQLEIGLEGVDTSRVVIGYEPVWAIGPGKTPPDRDYIQMIGKFVKGIANVPVVYGGGLKTDNAQMLASIPEIDGGLIALTRFKGDIGFYPDEYLEIIRTYMGR